MSGFGNTGERLMTFERHFPRVTVLHQKEWAVFGLETVAWRSDLDSPGLEETQSHCLCQQLPVANSVPCLMQHLEEIFPENKSFC